MSFLINAFKCFNLGSRKRADSDDSSSFVDKKDLDLPFAETLEAEPVKAVVEEVVPQDPETFYGNFNYPQFAAQSPKDVALASREESPDDRIVDLLLIMDCTSSMTTWLRLCRKTLKDCITDLQEENPDLQVRVAFLGYRDITDKDNIFVIQDFTFDVEHVKTLISETPARGGGDVPEDIQGALYQGLKLSWRKVSVKIAYLCTDAPCHGKAYHSLRDNFPDGNPARLELEELVTQYSNRDIDLTTYQLTGQTKNMYNIMEKAYNEGSNKGQMLRITLEKEIQQTDPQVLADDYEDENDNDNFNTSRRVPHSVFKETGTLGSKPKAKKKWGKKKHKTKTTMLENAYATNFRNDLRRRAKFQYQKHGWASKTAF